MDRAEIKKRVNACISRHVDIIGGSKSIVNSDEVGKKALTRINKETQKIILWGLVESLLEKDKIFFDETIDFQTEDIELITRLIIMNKFEFEDFIKDIIDTIIFITEDIHGQQSQEAKKE